MKLRNKRWLIFPLLSKVFFKYILLGSCAFLKSNVSDVSDERTGKYHANLLEARDPHLLWSPTHRIHYITFHVIISSQRWSEADFGNWLVQGSEIRYRKVRTGGYATRLITGIPRSETVHNLHRNTNRDHREYIN